MKKRHLRLSIKITILVALVIMVSLLISTAINIRNEIVNIREYVEMNIMNIAISVSKNDVIIEALDNKDSASIQEQISEILSSVENIQFIVISDMNSTRYSHPNTYNIGKKFKGGDENRIIETGESYISEAEGTLGKSLRAFYPIYNSEDKQIGFVCVGTLVKIINEIRLKAIESLIVTAIIGLIFGIVGAILLSKNIKDTLFGLEPHEIVHLYNEKKGMINAIHEGILAIDINKKITMINQSAIDILNINLNQEQIIGMNVENAVPATKLVRVLKSGQNEYNYEDVFNGTVVVANRVVIKDKEKTIGALATFRDRTQIIKMAEEITGVKQIIEALRANNHEFMNKLHVILGFIHTKKFNKAEKYIIDAAQLQEQITNIVTRKIKNTTIAALLIGKTSRAKELGIKFIINDDTYISKNTSKYNNDLVTIIGNLLENAFEADLKSNNEEKFVFLNIKDNDSKIEISVEDNGKGIKNENIDRVFLRGFTTKNDSGGVGLDLVRRSVKNANGKIHVNSAYGIGTTFKVILYKGEDDDKSSNN